MCGAALYVYGFPPEETPYDIRTVFNNFGKTLGIIMYSLNKFGKTYKHAKIGFVNREEAMKAMETVNAKGMYKVKEWGTREDNGQHDDWTLGQDMEIDEGELHYY